MEVKKKMAVTLEVLDYNGHRKYAPMTVEETQELVTAIEEGKVKGLSQGPYFLINKNTKRVIGKVDIKDNQELVMIPPMRGG